MKTVRDDFFGVWARRVVTEFARPRSDTGELRQGAGQRNPRAIARGIPNPQNESQQDHGGVRGEVFVRGNAVHGRAVKAVMNGPANENVDFG